MPIVLLVRHGQTAANAQGVLAGRSSGVELDETGRAQVAAAATRLNGVPITQVVSSPLERCVETAAAIAHGQTVQVDERLIECDYGDWTGKSLSDLSRLKAWRVVQDQPSAVVFPGGESLRAVQSRAVAAIRETDAQLASRRGRGKPALWIAVTHGDVIKAVVADALGMHLDVFQRLVIEPCSVTAISYTDRRPFVLKLNDTGSALGGLVPPRSSRKRTPTGDAAVGGETGDSTRVADRAGRASEADLPTREKARRRTG